MYQVKYTRYTGLLVFCVCFCVYFGERVGRHVQVGESVNVKG